MSDRRRFNGEGSLTNPDPADYAAEYGPGILGPRPTAEPRRAGPPDLTRTELAFLLALLAAALVFVGVGVPLWVMWMGGSQ